VPAGLDPAEVICLITDFLTAHQVMYDTAEVRPGERILVHGGAGGVGSAILQLGHLAGLRMYATASKANHGLVSELGATPIDYRGEDFVERVRSLTGVGVDVVFDPIGGATQLRRSYRCLAPQGRLVWFGVAAISRRGVRVIPESLVTRLILALKRDGRRAPLPNTTEQGAEKARVLAELIDLLAAGSIRPRITQRIPLEHAARAHRLLDQGGHAGKVVLVTEP
jgi:NADPH2:quinone reductase